jgi:hypothetical protein
MRSGVEQTSHFWDFEEATQQHRATSAESKFCFSLPKAMLKPTLLASSSFFASSLRSSSQICAGMMRNSGELCPDRERATQQLSATIAKPSPGLVRGSTYRTSGPIYATPPAT